MRKCNLHESQTPAVRTIDMIILEICYGEENSAKKIKGGGVGKKSNLVRIYSPDP